MRRFLLTLALFLAPLVAAWVFLEWKLSGVRNTYTMKLDLVEQKAATARILVLGSSHEYQGVAPALFDCEGLNLANNGQSLFYDSEIVRLYAGRFPQLRLLIQGVAYGSFEFRLGSSVERFRVFHYRRFLGTQLDSGASLWDAKNFSLIALYTPPHVIELARAGFRTVLAENMDEHGWYATDDLGLDPFDDTYGAARVAQHAAMTRPEYARENIAAVERTLNLMRERGVQVVFITSPVAPPYSSHIGAVHIERTRSALADFKARFGIDHVDYLTDTRFTADDFVDADHMSPQGAVKFSGILNEEVIRARGACGAGAAGR